MLISERIYQRMAELGMNQREFAARTGITQSTVSDWKRKGTNPSADKIMIICEVLGITPYELLLDTENRKMKEYTPLETKRTDYLVINKDSSEYVLIETYRRLNEEQKLRVYEYMKELSGKNNE